MQRFSVGRVRVYAKTGRERVNTRGSREFYWEARKTVDGSRKTVWRGWATPDEAEKAVSELVLLERATPEEGPPGSLAFLLAAWLAADVDNRGDLNPRTRKAYRRDAGHLTRLLGSARASTLTTDRVARYRDARLAEGAATSTVRQELKRLGSAWGWARNAGKVPDRTLALPKLRVVETKPKVTPRASEVRAVIASMEGREPMWAVIALRLLLATGARVGEVAELRWRHVGPTELSLPAKGGGLRPFPRTKGVDDALSLATRGDMDETVTGISPNTIRGKLWKLIRKHGGNFTPHGVRRCVEDTLADKEVDIKVYGDLLGHSPQVALEHYRRSTADSRAKAASLLDD